MISSGKELNRLARKWRKMTVNGRKRVSLLGTSNSKVIAGGVEESSVAEKGHFVIYTADQKRHQVPLSYLSNSIFVELLKLSEEEFGLSSHGSIMLPCDLALLEYIIFIVGQVLDRHQEKALHRSIFRVATPFAHLSIKDRQFFHQNNMEIAKSMELATLSYKQSSFAGPPHEALFLVLAYLPLFELLSMSEVCRSLRDAVEKDVLPWLNIIVERPLSLRLSDEILMKISSKANGRLRTLVLLYCAKITDDGLQRVIDQNPLISKLHIPGCTGLTPDGVIRAVQKISDCQDGLKSLWINGIANMKKEHLERLQFYLQTNQKLQQIQQKRQPLLYHNYRRLQAYRWEELGRVVDVELCPKCNEVRVVFDCPREECKRKRENSMTGCKMCMFCIPRCEECGKCVENGDLEETVCADTLCPDCWIQLPKCNFCNKPCCTQHANMQIASTGSVGWICSICHDKSDDFE